MKFKPHIIIEILSLCIVFLIVLNLRLYGNYKILIKENIHKEEYFNFQLLDIQKRRLFEISTNNKKFINENSFVNRFGKNIQLKTIVKNKLLVFYFNTKACHSCLDEELELLKQTQSIVLAP